MANVSTNPFGSSVIASNFATKPNRCSSVRCACFSPSSGNWQESRRLVSISLLLSNLLLFPNESTAASIFDKYVKRKKLDPLESYVPAVILTQLQIQDLEKSLELDQPQYDSCRSLLRSGPAASFRVNIRAVAQYASEDGNGKTATDDVDQCLRALEELDSMLLRASRNDRDVSVKSMKAKITLALNSLEGLLNTVPPDVLDKAKAIADSYRNLDEDYANPEISDPELKKLESIL